jgi:putative two-component system response regulator
MKLETPPLGDAQVQPVPDDVALALERLSCTVATQRKAPSAEATAVLHQVSTELDTIANRLHGHEPSASGVYCDLAAHWFHAAEPQAALAAAGKAVELARQTNDPKRLRLPLLIRAIAQTELGAFAAALESLNEALDCAVASKDVAGQCAVWNQIGLLLFNQGLAREASSAFDRVLELVDLDGSLLQLRITALSNKGLAAIDLPQQAGGGIHAALAALAMAPEPRNAEEKMRRVSMESIAAQLLGSIGEAGAAKKHAAAARRFADEAGFDRGLVLACIADGWANVAAKNYDEAFSQLRTAVDMARHKVKVFQFPALRSLIAAYDAAGQTELAKVYLEELHRLNRETKEQLLLDQQRRHMQKVLGAAPSNERTALDLHVEDQRERLSGRGLTRESMRDMMQLLEEHANAAELHDDNTSQHIFRVGRMSALLAKEIELDVHTQEMLDLAARVHDIGKLFVPNAIILKPGKLTAGEREIMQRHTTQGAEYLAKTKTPMIALAIEIAKHHHEKYDGTGYPDGLRGSAIPISARIAALADVFDALTHERPYKAAWSVSDSLKEIASLRGTHFDPDLTDVFVALVPRLQREVGDLDTFLAQDAFNSRFVMSRRALAEKLKGNDPTVSSFDLRR